jgi:hypothetical protein
MLPEICDRCNTVEESYEFMLAYAAQGLPSDKGSQAGKQIRDFLHHAADALRGLAEICTTTWKTEGLEPEKFLAFCGVLDHDARNSLAAIELVLDQPTISSQLIDNLNASIHLRAVLTDLFLLGDIVRTRLQQAIPATAGETA